MGRKNSNIQAIEDILLRIESSIKKKETIQIDFSIKMKDGKITNVVWFSKFDIVVR